MREMRDEEGTNKKVKIKNGEEIESESEKKKNYA